jgi:hypothetical protein
MRAAPTSRCRLAVLITYFGIPQSGYDLLLGQPRAVVSFDQQRHAAAVIDMPRPAYRVIEEIELLEQVTVFSRGEMDCEPRGPE